jgi:hypothetical protein
MTDKTRMERCSFSLLPVFSFQKIFLFEERKPRIHSEKTGEANTKSSITHRDFILFYFIFWVVLFFFDNLKFNIYFVCWVVGHVSCVKNVFFFLLDGWMDFEIYFLHFVSRQTIKQGDRCGCGTQRRPTLFADRRQHAGPL